MSITSTPETTAVNAPSDAADPTGNPAFAPAEKVDMPFRTLFIDDLTPGRTPDDWSEASVTWSVNANTFAEKLAELAPSISFEVENRMSDTPALLDIDLTVTALKDVRPDAVVDAVPMLQKLQHVRDAVARVEARDIDLTAFQASLDEHDIDPAWAQDLYERLSDESGGASSSSVPDGLDDDGSLDRLLGMVDTGEGSGDAPSSASERRRSGDTARAASALDALIQAATGGPSTSPDVDRSAVEALLAELDDLIQSQLGAIYDNEALTALERAWRSLKLLVDRFDTRKGAVLEVLACPVEDLPEATYEQVLMPEHGRTDGPALSMIVCGTTFGRSTADVERMRDLAETGLSLQTPILASVDHGFFGVDATADLSDLPILWQHLDGPAYTEWSKLRSEDAAEFLTLCLPPFVLRAERDGKQHTVKRPLYGPGAVMLATAIAKSYARTGWPTHLGDGKSEPVRECEIAATQKNPSPLSTLIPSRKQSELSDAGFAVLDAREKEDAIYVSRAPTVKEPRTYQTTEANAEARSHAALACRMFVSRAAHFMLDLQDNLPEDLEPQDASAWLTGQITSFLRQGDVDEIPGECISIDPVDSAKLPGMTVFAVRIAPPDTIVDLEHEISLVLGFKVPGDLPEDADEADPTDADDAENANGAEDAHGAEDTAAEG